MGPRTPAARRPHSPRTSFRTADSTSPTALTGGTRPRGPRAPCCTADRSHSHRTTGTSGASAPPVGEDVQPTGQRILAELLADRRGQPIKTQAHVQRLRTHENPQGTRLRRRVPSSAASTRVSAAASTPAGIRSRRPSPSSGTKPSCVGPSTITSTNACSPPAPPARRSLGWAFRSSRFSRHAQYVNVAGFTPMLVANSLAVCPLRRQRRTRCIQIARPVRMSDTSVVPHSRRLPGSARYADYRTDTRFRRILPRSPAWTFHSCRRLHRPFCPMPVPKNVHHNRASGSRMAHCDAICPACEQ